MKIIKQLSITLILSLSLNSCYSISVAFRDPQKKIEENIDQKFFKYIFKPFIEDIDFKNKQLIISLHSVPTYLEQKKLNTISSKDFNFSEYGIFMLVDVIAILLITLPLLLIDTKSSQKDKTYNFVQKNPKNIAYIAGGVVLADSLLSFPFFIHSEKASIENKYVEKSENSFVLKNANCHIFWNNYYTSLQSNYDGKITIPIDNNFKIDKLSNLEINLDLGESSEVDIENSISPKALLSLQDYEIQMEYYNNAINFSKQKLYDKAIVEINKIDPYKLPFDIEKMGNNWQNILKTKQLKELSDNSYKLKNKKFKQEYDNAYKFAIKKKFSSAVYSMSMISKLSPFYFKAQNKIKEWNILLENIKYQEIYQQSVSLAVRGQVKHALKNIKSIPFRYPNYKLVKEKIKDWEEIIFDSECDNIFKQSENFANKNEINKAIKTIKKIPKRWKKYDYVIKRINNWEITLKEKSKKISDIQSTNVSPSKGLLAEVERQLDIDGDRVITGKDWGVFSQKQKYLLFSIYYVAILQTQFEITPSQEEVNRESLQTIDKINYFYNNNNQNIEVLNIIYEIYKN